jgi:outer membrane protein assembly factor BamE (lipoprotein component of BamABCDE complex)
MKDGMRLFIPILSAFILVACASYSGTGLKPGESRLEDVVRIMGNPAMRWQDPDGSQQLAYPRGIHTFMVQIGSDGKMQRIENVMDMKTFARIRPDMTKNQVLHILGPSEPSRSDYFKARDELVWEWRYCDAWNEAARFDVLFDGHKEVVRSTMSLTESQMGLCGREGSCLCARAK